MTTTHRAWRVPLHRQDVRRGLVLWVLVLCAAMIVAPIDWFHGHFLLLVAPLLVLNLILRRATRRIAVASDETLDERDVSVRNSAYRQTFTVLAVMVGLPLWLALLSAGNTSWLAHAASNTGLVLAYLELFYFLPTLIVVWREPDGSGPFLLYWDLNRRQQVALSLIVVLLLLPVISSVSLAFGAHTESGHHLQSFAPPSRSHLKPSCGYFGAQKGVGGVVGAEIQLSTELCWNGKRIWQEWGLNRSDCLPIQQALTTTTTHCRTRFRHDGTMDVRYHADVHATLLPFLRRAIDIRLVVRPDGRVLTFP